MRIMCVAFLQLKTFFLSRTRGISREYICTQAIAHPRIVHVPKYKVPYAVRGTLSPVMSGGVINSFHYRRFRDLRRIVST